MLKQAYASVELDVAEKVAAVAMPANVKAVVAVPDAKSSADVQVHVNAASDVLDHLLVNANPIAQAANEKNISA